MSEPATEYLRPPDAVLAARQAAAKRRDSYGWRGAPRRLWVQLPAALGGQVVAVWSSWNEWMAGRFCRVELDAAGVGRGSCEQARGLASSRCVHAVAAEAEAALGAECQRTEVEG